jgi:hypothetical protein
MMIPLAASVARRRFANVAIQQQRRTMAGGHAPAPKWEGIDKVVRGYFPQDYQRESQILSHVSKIPNSLSNKPFFPLQFPWPFWEDTPDFSFSSRSEAP